MYAKKSITVILAVCLTAVQAGAIIGRNGMQTNRDSVEVNNNGISVKSGYESYVHSNALENRKQSDSWFSSSQMDMFKALIMYKSSFLPIIGLKIVKILMHFVVALFIGIASTTAVCSFTSLCNISFEAPEQFGFSDKKDLLPQLREALEVVSRIPNILKHDQMEETSSVVRESTSNEEIVDPRNLKKNLDDEDSSSKARKSSNEALIE